MQFFSATHNFVRRGGPLQLVLGGILGTGSGELVLFLYMAYGLRGAGFLYLLLFAEIVILLTAFTAPCLTLDRLKDRELAILSTKGAHLEAKQRYFRLMYASGAAFAVIVAMTVGCLVVFGLVLIWVVPIGLWLALATIACGAWLWIECPF